MTTYPIAANRPRSNPRSLKTMAAEAQGRSLSQRGVRPITLVPAPWAVCPPCNNNCNQGRDCPARKKP